MFSNQQVKDVYHQFGNLLVKTPCVWSPYLSNLTKAKVYLKLENLQRTGSFKERGVVSFLLRHKEKTLSHVVTASAGNHAQALARHAARLNLPTTIFMPIGTANTKVAETERLQAKVLLVGETYDEAYQAALLFADQHSALYVHAYNDLQVIIGQATVALEIEAQIGSPDAIFVPVGGGGLIASIAQFFANRKAAQPKIIGVEADHWESLAAALNKGRPLGVQQKKTIAEGIAIRKAGAIPIEICQQLKPELFAVSDDQIQAAVILLLERQKAVAEGAGAASVAAFLSDTYRHSFYNKTVVLVVSGGNIDISLLARLTAQELTKSHRLSRMSIVIKDSPGSLSALLRTITTAFGNIVDIRHERLFANIRWNEVLVDLTVETKNELHERLMLSALKSEGYVPNLHQGGA